MAILLITTAYRVCFTSWVHWVYFAKAMVRDLQGWQPSLLPWHRLRGLLEAGHEAEDRVSLLLGHQLRSAPCQRLPVQATGVFRDEPVNNNACAYVPTGSDGRGSTSGGGERGERTWCQEFEGLAI
jgi:hypothetical protein